jgi:hypothetical protein
MPNRWVEHVKEFSRKKGLSYGCAISDPECKATYKSNKAVSKVSVQPVDMGEPSPEPKKNVVISRPKPTPKPTPTPKSNRVEAIQALRNFSTNLQKKTEDKLNSISKKDLEQLLDNYVNMTLMYEDTPKFNLTLKMMKGKEYARFRNELGQAQKTIQQVKKIYPTKTMEELKVMIKQNISQR